MKSAKPIYEPLEAIKTTKRKIVFRVKDSGEPKGVQSNRTK
jgi:hypothetical protein